ncbi:TrlF family AAA-like ATPase [Segatella oris]|uniref:TrlF family AAA-like ATPase n=1 Tax=Segatella oris TaxID=28135 RepID=UPI0028E6F2C0|nr:PHP domain-containing protein [Segatella oris]
MNTGALFYKADLHIHSYGEGSGSFDVIDTSNSPQAIVETAITKGLKIISITDHNQFLNSLYAVNYAKNKDIDILVIPGIEVSTTQGHLLLYFDKPDDLQQFYGKLTFNEDKSLCHQGIAECLNFANQYGGIGILAHITLESGFEKTINRYGPQMEQIFKCKNLLGLEITDKSDVNLFTDLDDKPEHKHLLDLWRTTLNNQLHRDFAKLMSSDSHTLDKLGKNAEGENRLTRIKMPTLTFRSFRFAMLSSESRVRLEECVPEQHPTITHIKIEGGLLDGIDTELSPNLTCIIGSRGAGKSTLLESIRETSGNSSNSKLCDSEVWAQNILLSYFDEAGQEFSLRREKNASVINCSDPNNGITLIPIESYGQGDTASTLQHSDENPKVIIDFLDSFLNLDLLHQQDEEYINLLRSNQSEMKKLRINLAALPEARKALVNEKNKLKELEKTKAADIVKFHNALIQEREFRKSLITQLNELVRTYREILGDKSLFNDVAAMDDTKVIVGKEYFKNVKSIVDNFSKLVTLKSTELNSELKKKIEELKQQLTLWGAKEQEINEQIDAKKVKRLNEYQKKLSELQRERKEILENRENNRTEIYRLHLSFAQKVNRDLKSSIDDFSISIKYVASRYSPEFEEVLKSLMGWRTSQVSKAKIIASNISISEFIHAVKDKNMEIFRNILYNGERLLQDADIENIFFNILEENHYEDLECLSYDDLPQIIVTKFIQQNGVNKPIIKSISQLSLGQQQSVLLGILMLSDSNKPLLIDQPEDNLDSEFIFKTIVSNLRKIKEHRQVIIVTHNLNIAVLGDAELIIPLRSTSVHSIVDNAGSVDNLDTINQCCQILEGGESAFKQRKNVYGF